MCVRFLATLLILGWVSLSCIDILEDLDETPGQVHFSSSSPDDAFGSKRGVSGPQANNMVESAVRMECVDIVPAGSAAPAFEVVSSFGFSRQSQLYTLYAVLQI